MNRRIRLQVLCLLAVVLCLPGASALAGGAQSEGGGVAAIDGHQVLTPGQTIYSHTHDGTQFDRVNWAVMAYKSRHQLVVYFKGRMFKTYRAVFGRNHTPGTKLWEGDLRTPEGVYKIIKKYDSRRWRRFLRLNYPDVSDVHRYDTLLESGVVPDEDDGAPRPVGGAIGIHGTDKPRLNSSGVDWTAGCISVDNDSIAELDRLLPIGTVIIIKP